MTQTQDTQINNNYIDTFTHKEAEESVWVSFVVGDTNSQIAYERDMKRLDTQKQKVLIMCQRKYS